MADGAAHRTRGGGAAHRGRAAHEPLLGTGRPARERDRLAGGGVFDVEASAALGDEQKRRIAGRAGRVVRASAQDTRSQARNRQLALERLRAKLESALAVQRTRRATKPTASSRHRRVESKKRRGETKRARRRPSGDDH